MKILQLTRPGTKNFTSLFIKGGKGWTKSIVAVLLIGGMIAARSAPDNSKAEANQIQGLYIFTDSKPTHEYEYLGTVTLKFSGSTQYQPVRDQLIKKLRKQYPEADGAIFQFSNEAADHCDAIKFKP